MTRACATLVTLSFLMLAVGCSGDDATEPDASDTATTAADGSTVPGTELELGDLATVNFDAGKLGATQLRLGVKAVKEGKISDLAQFELPVAARNSRVYYVRVVAKNLDQVNVGGSMLTLFGQVSDSLVVRPVTFGSTFSTCNYGPLPAKFGKGARTNVCMVMLAPKDNELGAVEWRGEGDDAPISWELP